MGVTLRSSGVRVGSKVKVVSASAWRVHVAVVYQEGLFKMIILLSSIFIGGQRKGILRRLRLDVVVVVGTDENDGDDVVAVV